jgi:hypothetical protein
VNLTLGDIILAVAGMPIEANAGNYRKIRDRLWRAQPGSRSPSSFCAPAASSNSAART